MEEFRKSFRTTRPYYDFLTAVYWCINNDYELEQALAWVDRAIYFRVMGEKNFRTLSAKAAVLNKMNKQDEARNVMDEALPMGTMYDVHSYARQLVNQKLPQEAFKVFKMNYDKYPNEHYTHVGMGRGYAALGDTKNALKFMKSALAKANDEGAKTNIKSLIKNLEEGNSID